MNSHQKLPAEEIAWPRCQLLLSVVTVSRSLFSLIGICLLGLVFCIEPVFAADNVVKNKNAVKYLIGLESATGKFSNGWRTEESASYGKGKNYALVTNGRFSALVLEDANSHGGILKWKITDAVLLTGHSRDGAWHSLSTDCKADSSFVNTEEKSVRQFVVAEVMFKKCSRYSSNVLSAWLIDATQGTIQSRPSKGLRCGNTFLDSGEISECKFVPREY